jgi:Uma2 family endonuclease
MKVKLPPTLPNSELTFYYPDVQVACSPEKEKNDYFREYPAVIFEVLSPSTSPTDEREKRAAYLRIDSLEHYCIVAQEKMEVTVYRRRGRNWEIMRWTQPDDVVILGGIECELTLGQIYERVSWNAAGAGTA